MRYTTKTEYGINSMIYLAKLGPDAKVTIKDIAKSQGYPAPFIEKILQAFRQAKLVTAQSGNQGGYRLAKPACEITVKEIIEALEGHTFDVFCSPEVREDIVCSHFCLCGVKPMWRKTKKILDDFYSIITLEMLTKDEMEVEHTIPSPVLKVRA